MTKQILDLVKPYHFKELIKQGLSLDQVYLLSLVKEGFSLDNFSSRKEAALIQSLQRKLLITDGGQVSSEGEKIFELLASVTEAELKKADFTDNGFEEWWKTYPATDTVMLDGKVIYEGSRGLRQKKDECRTKFTRIIMEKNYTAAQLIAALKYEVQLKVKQSIARKENKMTYMQNSLTYLNQRTFANFVDLAATTEIKQIQKQNSGTINI